MRLMAELYAAGCAPWLRIAERTPSRWLAVNKVGPRSPNKRPQKNSGSVDSLLRFPFATFSMKIITRIHWWLCEVSSVVWRQDRCLLSGYTYLTVYPKKTHEVINRPKILLEWFCVLQIALGCTKASSLLCIWRPNSKLAHNAYV